LLDLSRGRAANSFERSVDVQISRLRRKLTEAGVIVADSNADAARMAIMAIGAANR